MNNNKDDGVNFLRQKRDSFDSYYNISNDTELIEDVEEDYLNSEHFVKHLMPVNSKNLFVFLFLLVAMNIGLAILVMMS